jgi:hypothetical protein
LHLLLVSLRLDEFVEGKKFLGVHCVSNKDYPKIRVFLMKNGSKERLILYFYVFVVSGVYYNTEG